MGPSNVLRYFVPLHLYVAPASPTLRHPHPQASQALPFVSKDSATFLTLPMDVKHASQEVGITSFTCKHQQDQQAMKTETALRKKSSEVEAEPKERIQFTIALQDQGHQRCRLRKP